MPAPKVDVPTDEAALLAELEALAATIEAAEQAAAAGRDRRLALWVAGRDLGVAFTRMGAASRKSDVFVHKELRKVS
jgi:hypothetical protein